jgi:hypothetical protein
MGSVSDVAWHFMRAGCQESFGERCDTGYSQALPRLPMATQGTPHSHPGPLPGFRHKKFSKHRVENDSQTRDIGHFECNGAPEVWNTMHIVNGSVKRVDQPAMVCPPSRAFFFTEDRPRGKAAAQERARFTFPSSVGERDRITGTFPRNASPPVQIQLDASGDLSGANGNPRRSREARSGLLPAAQASRSHLIPVWTNDWMNCRWKMRNATKSGATMINVAADTTPHCAPVSLLFAKIARPTVSGRDSIELVTMSGQRKLFQ